MLIACYCRVSTDEQARHGLSIDTQLDNLREWAKQNGHTIVGEFVDAGVSGRKPYTKTLTLIRDGKKVQRDVRFFAWEDLDAVEKIKAAF